MKKLSLILAVLAAIAGFAFAATSAEAHCGRKHGGSQSKFDFSGPDPWQTHSNYQRYKANGGGKKSSYNKHAAAKKKAEAKKRAEAKRRAAAKKKKAEKARIAAAKKKKAEKARIAAAKKKKAEKARIAAAKKKKAEKARIAAAKKKKAEKARIAAAKKKKAEKARLAALEAKKADEAKVDVVEEVVETADIAEDVVEAAEITKETDADQTEMQIASASDDQEENAFDRIEDRAREAAAQILGDDNDEPVRTKITKVVKKIIPPLPARAKSKNNCQLFIPGAGRTISVPCTD